ncbi:hypothetical protein [Lacticaseibacillus kribbianus]|uniref:hypothetical protein n=1 Tax=Lacticaseibacillus kribbianus TaxID=2926292 RepID=UPI001CD302B9|nr:hypothetical protein [Lacticaseibacillus kribbianus]
METLKTYLDGLFASVPMTAKTKKAKQDLLDLMTDHYHSELAKGKTQAEAIGLVIGEFGDVDELLDALEVDSASGKRRATGQSARPLVTPDEAEGFWAGTERFAQLLGLGIALIIGGLGLTVLASNTGDALPALVFLATTGAGIALIIAASLGYRTVSRAMRKRAVTAETHALADERATAYNRPRTVGLIGGIGMFFIALFLPIISNYGTVTGNDAGAAFLMFVAAGVYFIVYTSIIAGGFGRLARATVTTATEPDAGNDATEDADDWDEDWDDTTAAKQARQASPSGPRARPAQSDRLARIRQFYWPVLTTVFLFFGFVVEAWTPAIFILIVGGLFEKPIFGKHK